jgi:hypothetical protein
MTCRLRLSGIQLRSPLRLYEQKLHECVPNTGLGLRGAAEHPRKHVMRDDAEVGSRAQVVMACVTERIGPMGAPERSSRLAA